MQTSVAAVLRWSSEVNHIWEKRLSKQEEVHSQEVAAFVSTQLYNTEQHLDALAGKLHVTVLLMLTADSQVDIYMNSRWDLEHVV